MIGLFSLPAVMVMTTKTTQMTTMQTRTTTQTTTKMTTTQTTTTMTAICLDEHWTLNANGTMRTPLAQRIAKCRQVKPAVDIILRAGNNAVRQGALLRGVLDHPSMFSAQKMAAIDSSKESAAEKYVVGQSAARKRARRRARRRASRAMVRSSRRASMARGTRRMMLLLISLGAR